MSLRQVKTSYRDQDFPRSLVFGLKDFACSSILCVSVCLFVHECVCLFSCFCMNVYICV